MKKIQFIIIPTILSFGLIISSALISNALDKVNKNENRITVKGVAERRIKADKALINIVISKKSENLDELKKDISEREKLIINLIIASIIRCFTKREKAGGWGMRILPHLG